MKNKVALFLEADPLTVDEIEVIKTVKKLFSQLDIILDRKSQENEYMLSYTDRIDIIYHDLKENNISDFNIVPNDLTLLKTLKSNDYDTLILGMPYADKNSKIHSRAKFVHQLSNKMSIMMIPTFKSTSKDLIKMMLNEKFQPETYLKYISEYAYLKTKFKLIRKIGITNDKDSIVCNLFKDHDIEVIDLDNVNNLKNILKTLNDKIQSCNDKIIAIKSNKLFDLKLDEMCNDVIYISDKNDIKKNNVISINPKSEIKLKNDVITLINKMKKIKK